MSPVIARLSLRGLRRKCERYRQGWNLAGDPGRLTRKIRATRRPRDAERRHRRTRGRPATVGRDWRLGAAAGATAAVSAAAPGSLPAAAAHRRAPTPLSQARHWPRGLVVLRPPWRPVLTGTLPHSRPSLPQNRPIEVFRGPYSLIVVETHYRVLSSSLVKDKTMASAEEKSLEH